MLRNVIKFTLLSLLLTAFAAQAFAVPFFRIDSSTLSQLDADTYRLRLIVDWSEDALIPPEMEGVNASPADPYFYRFCLSAPDLSYNYYCEDQSGYAYPYNYSSDWSATPMYHTPGNLGLTFGFDFDLTTPTFEPLLLNYTANFAFVSSVYNLSTYEQYGDLVSEKSYNGSFLVTTENGLTPEPTSMALFALGLLGAGFYRRFKR